MPPPYDAILFDLLTALLDSWTLWNAVTGDEERGMRWRAAYLKHTYETGGYRSYESLVAEAASVAGYPQSLADDLVTRWDELQPWPAVTQTLDALRPQFRLGIVTNCSEGLAQRAARRAGIFDVVVSAERAGFYKPHSHPYRMALNELKVDPARTLFVAGSPFDLVGAASLNMPVFWHNHIGMALPFGIPRPAFESREFTDLLRVAFTAEALS